MNSRKSKSQTAERVVCDLLFSHRFEKTALICKSQFQKTLVALYHSRKKEKNRAKTYIASQEKQQCALFCPNMQGCLTSQEKSSAGGMVNAAGSEAGLPMTGLSNRSRHPPASNGVCGRTKSFPQRRRKLLSCHVTPQQLSVCRQAVIEKALQDFLKCF